MSASVCVCVCVCVCQCCFGKMCVFVRVCILCLQVIYLSQCSLGRPPQLNPNSLLRARSLALSPVKELLFIQSKEDGALDGRPTLLISFPSMHTSALQSLLFPSGSFLSLRGFVCLQNCTDTDADLAKLYCWI